MPTTKPVTPARAREETPRQAAEPGGKPASKADGTASERASIVCSFCLKPTGDVESMVAGPGVYICNECVDLCVQIIASKHASEPIPATWEERLSDDDLLAMLPKISATGVQVDRQLDKFVRHARTRGITWTRIGMALGTTRQSAWERFAGEE